MPAVNLSFLQDPSFYTLLALGCLAMIPRARYTADRMMALTPEAAANIRPSLPQRVSLFIPGLCVFACIVMFGYAWGALLLLVAYLAVYVGLILLFKRPPSV
jgi:hypothetical protein